MNRMKKFKVKNREVRLTAYGFSCDCWMWEFFYGDCIHIMAVKRELLRGNIRVR